MLFGHQNDDANQPTQTVSASPVGVNPLAVDPETGASLPVAPADPPMPPDSNEPSVLNQPTAPAVSTAASSSDDVSTTDVFAPTSAPAVPTSPEDEASPFTPPANTFNVPEPTTPEPTAPSVEPTFSTPMVSTPLEPTTTSTSMSSDSLLSLKQQALTQLEPLVNQLDQTPEEKFRTTMMLIQSTDNQSLIQDAYATAQLITDEKVRAQALLDVINEINYFTQQQTKE